MGDLREQLIKAGLLDEKKAKRIAHEERVKKSREGRDVKEREARQRHQEMERKQRAKRKADQSLEKDKQEQLKSRENRARVRKLVRDELVRDGMRGPRRFHYVTRDGSVPFLQIDVSLARRLEAGELGIVEIPGEDEKYGVVPAAVASELLRVDSDSVRFFTRG